MPGLKQLEKFNSDILSLGNEAELRSQRGEDVILPPIPPTAKDEDDSDDFVLGLPLKKEGAENDAAASPSDTNAAVDIPDITSIGSMENGDDMPDLSLFDDEPVADEGSVEEDTTTSQEREPEIADAGLDALLGDFESLTDLGGEDALAAANDSSAAVSADDELLGDADIDAVLSNASAMPNEDVPPRLDDMPPLDDLPSLDEMPALDELPNMDETLNLDETPSLDDISSDIPAATTSEKDDSVGGADVGKAEDVSLSDIPDDFGATPNSSAHFDDEAKVGEPEDVSLPDDFTGIENVSVADETAPPSEDAGNANGISELNSLDNVDDFGELDSLDDLDNANSTDYVQPGESFSLDDLASFVGDNGDGLNLEDMNLVDVSQDSGGNLTAPSDNTKVQNETEETPAEVADDDLGFEIEDYSAPEETSAMGEGALSETNAKGDSSEDSAPEKASDAADDDLGFEIEDYSAPEESSGTGEGALSESNAKGASSEGSAPEKASEATDDDLGFEIEDYSVPEESALSEDALNGIDVTGEAKPDSTSDNSSMGSGDDLDFDIEDYTAPSASASSEANPLDDFSQGGDDMNLPDMDGSDNLGEMDLNIDEGIPDETFDTSAMDDLEFPSTDEQLSDDGFELDNDAAIGDEFEIPGFSDVVTVEEKKKTKASRQNEDEEENLGLPPNTLSDEQYKKFLENLATYPLNVRIAFEQLITEDEFTDETEFELIKKVVRKIPARQLASELEKMLDIAIPVPRDYERRTTEEYEAYKSSLQYQIKNRIVPAIALGVIASALCTLFFLFGKHFIYEPARAASLYRQGYELLEDDDYPQSEIKFNEASKYDAQKKWFFRYARAYRAKKQYIRAEQMYKAILAFFKHDKQAGLEYARMELDDLENYEKAENVLLRECLDYHINDADCILLLGDTYLEWATEKDPQKFEDARTRYSELISLYGQTDLYMSRMLRYFIRTDNLLEVLTLKEQFMPKKKESALGAEDWTALSGFLLDKLYGYLKPSEEYLRSKIEDVKETLSRALRADPTNPLALYNFSRYYMVMNNNTAAQSSLLKTIDAFSKTPSLKKRDMYKYINSYKFLGEQLMEQRDYLKAREAYTSGISLFDSERERSNLLGTSEIGELYADMADLDYFISGDMESAKANYELSITNDNDNGKIRYKIGNIQYGKRNYSEALGSFMKAAEEYPDDTSLLIAMGNTLSMRDDTYAAIGYYDHLKNILDFEKTQKGILFPQTDAREAELVDTYMRTANNLGVSLYKLSRLTGNSALNAQAVVNFQESLRAWDALTRNQQTLVRLGGSNLAEQNIRYLLQSIPEFEPAIYTEIPNTLAAEEGVAP